MYAQQIWPQNLLCARACLEIKTHQMLFNIIVSFQIFYCWTTTTETLLLNTLRANKLPPSYYFIVLFLHMLRNTKVFFLETRLEVHPATINFFFKFFLPLQWNITHILTASHLFVIMSLAIPWASGFGFKTDTLNKGLDLTHNPPQNKATLFSTSA